MTVGLLRFLRDVVTGPAPLPTQLGADKAIMLAAAAAAPAEASQLQVFRIERRAGRIVWIVATPTKDAQWWAIIDDADGRVVETGRWAADLR